VLLDLEIKADGQSIRPRIQSGMSVLHEIRGRFPNRSAAGTHLLPVIVVSGHGYEPNNVIGAYDGGIDAFIMKPLNRDNQDIGAKIRQCLERAGRGKHGACDRCCRAMVPLTTAIAPTAAALDGEALQLAIEPATGRIVVRGLLRFGDADSKLIHALYNVFQADLTSGRLPEKFRHLTSWDLADELKIEEPTVRRRISRCRSAVQQACRRQFRRNATLELLIESAPRQGYRLNPRIRFVAFDAMSAAEPLVTENDVTCHM
jgi:DNA-binding response OmpR family regulator